MLSGWLILGLMMVSTYPWGRWLVGQSASDDDQRLLGLVLGIGLGVGVLTLVMLCWGFTGIPFNQVVITLLYLLLMSPGCVLWWRDRHRFCNQRASQSLCRWHWLVLTGLLIISTGVLFNAAYWPFSKADTLGIYHRYGLLMYETGVLVPFAGRNDAFYQAYPMLMPLAYAFSYMVSGNANEYLARVIPALLSLGCIPAVYLTTKALASRNAAWLSAFLLGTTPTFVRWASSGYVDLPMAFYYTMAALFILRLMCGQRAVDALLAGVMLGLAAWTKNAALVGVGLVGLWSLVALWRGWVRWRHVVIVGTACAAIAAPWYIRNWIEARLIVPPTAWVDQAEHGLNTGLAFVIYTQDFGLTGWLILIGVGVLIVMFTKRSSTENRSVATLLWLTLPFYGVWWLLVSYDLRFLLLILQLFCVLAAAGLWAMWMRLSQPAQLRLRPALIVIAIALMVIGAWLSVEFKDEILRNPLMSDADKRALVLGER